MLSGCQGFVPSSTNAEVIGMVSSNKQSRVRFENHQLYIDDEQIPQLFGAELQYFRIRGGQEKNIPKSKVVELWTEALSRMKEAGMNTICFYIPWDFHEYKEGAFDFSGSVDEDQDGNPDYPSRDLFTFFKLIEEHGIEHIMVRPGPYINAEWGFLGFGAIPQWFHEKYPDSHMRSPKGNIAKLYDYHDKDLHRHTKLWFTALYNDVLKTRIGPGKPIFAIQVDNETNFQWQSIHNLDFSEKNQSRYREYLKSVYKNIQTVSTAHGKSYKKWDDISAPVTFSENPQEDGDWYRFADVSIYEYLKKIQSIWLELGVSKKDVLFTLAESYNAMSAGLIPSLDFRNDPDTGMTTVNLYPKTDPRGSNPLLNHPFKADHDVRVTDAANDRYFANGSSNEWVLGPEIQGGWWRGCDVHPKARQQTYLTTIGHGMKALYIYYFTEGDNWGGTWEKQNIRKIFEEFRKKPKYQHLQESDLSTFALDRPQIVNEFWEEVSNEYRAKHFFYSLEDKNWAQWTMQRSNQELDDLFFDTPLDKNIQPRNQYFDFIKTIGNKIVKPYGAWLAKATEVTDDILFLKDSGDHAPRGIKGLDNVLVNTDWSAGLYAYLLHAGYNPKVSVVRNGDFYIPKGTKVIFRYDYGRPLPAKQVQKLKHYVESGGVIVNVLEDSLTKQLGLLTESYDPEISDLSYLSYKGFDKVDQQIPVGDAPLKLSYLRAYRANDLKTNKSCEAVMGAQHHVVAYKCGLGAGQVIQLGASLQQVYNSNAYFESADLNQRNEFLKNLVQPFVAEPLVFVGSAKHEKASKVVAFARRVDDPTQKQGIWITLKSGHSEPKKVTLKFGDLSKLLSASELVVRDVLEDGLDRQMSLQEASTMGIEVELESYDSKVIFLERN